ncbi:hypothetical protein M4I33_15750 [Clostridium sp. LY3-2]|uniref:hypothetical protein n=1 Tax=Clostridium sp. LY3-2 TaxID=2942482 RepID=UPI0021523853|nr:hypothetical protein [Clostridium sp. LY3-2]MCR6516317.1 hypothetical protein [Clostridium sp. LY3-2]
MYKIKLNIEIYNYLINILDGKLKNKIKDEVYAKDNVYFNIDVDTKLDIMEYAEDKQLEIGFVNEDYLNEDGKKLQIIYDELYYQTNP